MERVINLGSLPASCGFQSDTGCFSNFFFEPIILVRTSIESRKKTEFTMIKLKGQSPYCPATPSEETTPTTTTSHAGEASPFGLCHCRSHHPRCESPAPQPARGPAGDHRAPSPPFKSLAAAACAKHSVPQPLPYATASLAARPAVGRG